MPKLLDSGMRIERDNLEEIIEAKEIRDNLGDDRRQHISKIETYIHRLSNSELESDPLKEECFTAHQALNQQEKEIMSLNFNLMVIGYKLLGMSSGTVEAESAFKMLNKLN